MNQYAYLHLPVYADLHNLHKDNLGFIIFIGELG